MTEITINGVTYVPKPKTAPTLPEPEPPQQITWDELVERFRAKEPKGNSLEKRAMRILWHKALDAAEDPTPHEPIYEDGEKELRWLLDDCMDGSGVFNLSTIQDYLGFIPRNVTHKRAVELFWSVENEWISEDVEALTNEALSMKSVEQVMAMYLGDPEVAEPWEAVYDGDEFLGWAVPV